MKKFLLLIVILIIGSAVWVFVQLQAPSARPQTVTFDVLPGQDVNTISRNLKQEELIKSKLLFETYLWLLRAENKVQAGTYRLSTGDDLFMVVRVLLGGEKRVASRVTLIEGWTLKQYRNYLVDRGMNGGIFDELTAANSPLKEAYAFLKQIPATATLEGYLFPDTYAIGTDRDIEPLLRKMLDNFDRKLSEAQPNIAVVGPSLHEVITMASILEREVRGTEDRKKVADIFYRRLKAGMALQSDATINYLTESGRDRSTAEDLEIDSPYNTYKYRGLPPGPIGNPGLDAIQAALMPSPNSYWYFLTGKDGTVYYGKNFEEHKRNRERYL